MCGTGCVTGLGSLSWELARRVSQIYIMEEGLADVWYWGGTAEGVDL